MGGHEMRICISLAPASRISSIRLREVVPRTIESSMTTTDFTLDHVMDRIKFNTDPEFTQKLGRLDKGAADIMVADHPHLIRQAQLLGIAQRRVKAGVRDPHDKIRFGRMLNGQLCPQPFSDLINIITKNTAVRSGKINILKNTKSFGDGRLYCRAKKRTPAYCL